MSIAIASLIDRSKKPQDKPAMPNIPQNHDCLEALCHYNGLIFCKIYPNTARYIDQNFTTKTNFLSKY